MYSIRKIVLTGCEIICCQILTCDITLRASNYILIKGIVYNTYGKPLSNAAIEIFQIDKAVYPPVEQSMGVTFTSEDGSYGVSLPRSVNKDYRLVAYASITT